MSMMDPVGKEKTCLREKHVKFFKRSLQVLPGRYSSLDTSRMTIAFFAISGIDILDKLEALEPEKDKLIEWIYSLQVMPLSTGTNLDQCGFRGSTTIGISHKQQKNESGNLYDSGHIAMTYTALLGLLILGDDLSRVNKEGLLAGVRKMQLPDGSFCPTPEGSENDMRFLYCAASISYILNDWSAVNVAQAIEYIRKSLSYEGAFAQGPGLEAHGGSTFCAVATLVLMDKLDEVLTPTQIRRLCSWCLMKQQSGFQGRPNKPVDTCYSFWVGATLQMLGAYGLTDHQTNHDFLMCTQDNMIGGFSKWPECTPDALHAYFGVCGLSLLGEAGLQPMHPALNISQRAATHLHQLHARTRLEARTPSNSHLHRDQHVAFFQRCLNQLTAQNSQITSNRLILASFAISGLDLLNAIDTLQADRDKYIDWIYSLQVTDVDNDIGLSTCIFLASAKSQGDYSQTNISMTHLALRSLVALGDDLSRVNRTGIIRTISSLQQASGSFTSNLDSSESDMRSAYRAVCISYILQDWSGINTSHLTHWVKDCLTENGFGQSPGQEAHGGATFHAVALLTLLGELDTTLRSNEADSIKQWCLCDQRSEDETELDSRAIYWTTATLVLLQRQDLAHALKYRQLLLDMQHKDSGGFLSKDGLSDCATSYYSLSSVCLLEYEHMKHYQAALSMSRKTIRHLRYLHQTWTECKKQIHI